jgi:hypothetical protein
VSSPSKKESLNSVLQRFFNDFPHKQQHVENIKSQIYIIFKIQMSKAWHFIKKKTRRET